MLEVLLRLAFRCLVLASSLGEATKSWWQFERLCLQLCVGKLHCVLLGEVRAAQNDSMVAAACFCFRALAEDSREGPSQAMWTNV